MTQTRLADAIGDRIRQARDVRGVTRGELATIMGCSEGAVRAYEEGRAAPGSAQLRALALALATRADWLLGLETGGAS